MAKPEKKQELAPVSEGGAVSAVMPDFMKKYAGQGGETVETDDLLIPRIALLQALSPQVAEKGERVGDFYHTTLEESLGAEVEVVPLFFRKMVLLWNPREAGGGILARSNDCKTWDVGGNQEFSVKIKGQKQPSVWRTGAGVKESGLTNWGTFISGDDKSQPAATEVYTFLCIIPERLDLGPVVVSLQRSQVRTAKKWLSRLMMSQAPFFGQRFIMASVDEKNKSGDPFKNFVFKPHGLVENAEEFEDYRNMFERFKSADIGIKDMEGMQNEAPDDDKGDAPEGKVSEKF